MDNFPLLSSITFLPLIGALIIFFVPSITKEGARLIAVIASLLSFLLSVVMLIAFNPHDPFEAGKPVPFEEHFNWLPGVGVSYHMGVDGIAVLLIGLTTLLSLIAVIWSWDTVDYRPRDYFITILLLETGMLGVFMALDLFLFYIFWELMLIPMALLIGVWGHDNRVYAAVKFFIYTLVGSLLMLFGIVATYQAYFNFTGVRTLNILELQTGWQAFGGAYSDVFQGVIFITFFIAFAVKVPMFPIHTWLPDAHVEAPVAGSVVLAAVMLKMGAYGMLRFNLPLFPEGAEDWGVVMIILSIIAIIYGALVAVVQPDMKKLVAYTSVSHMGFVTLGIFVNIYAHEASQLQGFDGAMVVMMAHGFNTGALFLCVGVLYERAHTRLIAKFGGAATRLPVFSAFFLLFMFASIGLPGLSGFVGEFLVAVATWHYNYWAAIITFTVVIFAAWYLLWMYQRIFFGRAPGELPEPGDAELTESEKQELAQRGLLRTHPAPMPVSGGEHDADAAGHAASEHADDNHGKVIPWPDLTLKEFITLAPLAVLTVVVGVYPTPIIRIAEPAFERILAPFLS